MKNRKWTNKQKLEIVLEGIKGHVPIAELCNKHQIQQTQYYDWKNHFLRHGEKIFQKKYSTFSRKVYSFFEKNIQNFFDTL